MKTLGWIVFVLLGIVLLISLHGYFYTTGLIDKYVDRCGAYPTLDEAIEADMRHNGFDPAWFEDYIKGPNREDVPFTWYVVPKVKPEFESQYQQAPKPEYYCGGSFYEHTRHGWVGMPEGFWNGFGLMDFWMGVFHLYGEEI